MFRLGTRAISKHSLRERSRVFWLVIWALPARLIIAHNARPNSALEFNGCNLFELEVDAVSLQSGAFAQGQPGQRDVIAGQGADLRETGLREQALRIHDQIAGERVGLALLLDRFDGRLGNLTGLT